MKHPLQSILVITKTASTEAAALGRDMVRWAARHGLRARAVEHCPGDASCGEAKGPRPDLILVLGGDGTFISVARQVLGGCVPWNDVPLAGINLGQVGFLAGLCRRGWREALERALEQGGFSSVARMALAYDILRAGERVRSGVAVNDLVVSRGALARLVRLGISFDGRTICSVRADGVVVSSPAGSTAYGVSAGGPLIHPDMDALCISPICPFLNDFRPTVLPAGGELRVALEDGRADVHLSLDGQANLALRLGDEVLVRRAGQPLLVADFAAGDYFLKLREKGFITQR